MIEGSEHFRISAPVFKSLLFSRTRPIGLYNIPDPDTNPAIVRYFATWNIFDVGVNVHLADSTSIDLVRWLPNRHFGGVDAMLKLDLEAASQDSALYHSAGLGPDLRS